jgi:hypothetical protein
MESNETAVENTIAGHGRWLRLVISLGVILAVVLVAVGYLIGARFGSSSDSSDNASDNAASGSAPAPAAGEDRIATAAAIVACMRKNGVPNYPDPRPDGSLHIDPQDGVDIGSPAFKNAENSCKQLIPGGGSAPQPNPLPSIDTRNYVACMRENGLPDFPEPVGGQFRYDESTDKFKAAHQTCKKFLPKNAPPPQGQAPPQGPPPGQ